MTENDQQETGVWSLVIAIKFYQPIPVCYRTQSAIRNKSLFQWPPESEAIAVFVLETVGVSAFHWQRNNQSQWSQEERESCGKELLRWVAKQRFYHLLESTGEVSAEYLLDQLDVPEFLSKERERLLSAQTHGLNQQP